MLFFLMIAKITRLQQKTHCSRFSRKRRTTHILTWICELAYRTDLKRVTYE